MYKKISLITDKEDMQDILDEFIDRFGEPPKETMALLKISLIRALGAKHGMTKIEAKDNNLVFITEKPSLEIWSKIFGLFTGISMRPFGQNMGIVYRINSKETAVDAALKILTAYAQAVNKNEEENKGE